MPTVLLAYYCALILVASIIGGMIPVWFQLTHRWMQFAVSFVAGVMLGIGVLHMLPHALLDATAAAEATIGDRKSTRLNSSHLVISYAVFCLKKKKRRYESTVDRKHMKSMITYHVA